MSDKPFRVILAAETPLIPGGNGEVDMSVFEEHLKQTFLLASYKIDGIRAVNRGGRLVSRTMKPIQNLYAQENFGHGRFHGLDGELLVPKQYGPTIYHDTYSAVMTHGCRDELVWHVFDNSDSKLDYRGRLMDLESLAKDREFWRSDIKLVEQIPVDSIDRILAFEQEALDAGYEGIILRRPDAPYKQNRSTLKQGYLMKFCRWLTSEAEVVGFEEMMHNDNVATTDARGFTVRSSHKANLRPAGMLGRFVVKDAKFEEPFGLSGELDHAFRKYVWEHQEEFLGTFRKYKYKPYGTKDKPRQPVDIGARDPSDMS